MQAFSFVFLILFGAAFGSPPLQLSPFTGFQEDISPSNGILAGVRLSKDLVPLHYDVQIRPIINLPVDDPEQFTAPGEVTIRLRCVTPTTNITLHSNDIDIHYDDVTVRIVQTSISIRIVTHTNDSSMSTYSMQLESSLDAGLEYEVFIPFTAKVGNRLSGLYRSSYLDAAGQQKWLATTQFQSIGARQAFPCFDEPGFRSTFNVTIGRAEGYHSLANAPLKETVPIPGMENWFWDIHEVTVSMPTYLVAMVISDFVSVDAPTGISTYDVKIWGPPTITNSITAEFSARSAAQIVSFFENYLESPYQFSKLDSAAIPDFAAGAMENWALNTYRIAYLIYFEGESTQMEQWREAAVIAHEISHHWWNDIWLNEGFASYMEIIGAASATGSDFDAMNRYPIDKIQLAMDFDAGATTQPIRSNVTDELGGIPSRIIYEKAASIIRMMQSFLGEATFIAAIRNYLDKYAYDNTVQDQLFEELQAQVDIDGTLTQYPVKAVLDSWTLQSGFPIVTLSWIGGSAVLISQEKFRLSQQQRNANSTQANDLWFVPISYATKSNPDFSDTNWKPKFWLDNSTASATHLIFGAGTDWIVLNPDARSYYRVLYDAHFFQLINVQLLSDHSVVSLASRSQLIDDYFKSAFAGYVPIEEALELTKYLENEAENTVWTTVFNNLRTPNRRMIDTPFYTKFSTYMLSKVTPALTRIGWEQLPSDRPVTIILRTQLLDWACALGSPQCTTLAEDYAIKLAEGTGVPADLQPMIFCKAVSISDSLNLPGEFSVKGFLLQQYLGASRAERFTVFINALACDAPSYILGWLELATSTSSPITTAHAVQLIQRLTENPVNRAMIINYFANDLVRIIAVLGESSVSSMVSSMAAYTSETTTSAQLMTVTLFQLRSFIEVALEVVTDGNVRSSLTASRTQLDANADWIATWGPKIDTWLDSQLSPE
ncbi:Aminopeptidase N [Folsomia candida]|uniref:Aminopeptidase n=1 Tax=Folsomia candida TaxID=158441 RepID=A0A226F1D9_FOLCA|nr:Aminopeptidase N [Folsomia candida]